MAGGDKDEVPMLSDTRSQLSDECHVELEGLHARSITRSSSMSTSMHGMGFYENERGLVSHTGPLRSEKTPFVPFSSPLLSNQKFEDFSRPKNGRLGGKTPAVAPEEFSSGEGLAQNVWLDENLSRKNEHLLKSGPLGRCNDPYCTTCPTYYNVKAPQQRNSRASAVFDYKFQYALYGDAKSWVRRCIDFLNSCLPGIMNPHAKVIQRWNKFFVISCLVAIFIDPLFFFLLSVEEDNKCIVLNWSLASAVAAIRSLTDFIYFLHILLQFRLAYINPESIMVGAGELVDHPKQIALHYLRGYFILDVFVVLPLPQATVEFIRLEGQLISPAATIRHIMILLVLPKYLGTSAANYAKNLLRAVVLLQYMPKIFRFLPLLAGQSASGFIFESAWANFVINLLIFILAGHVVGSCWYLFGLQRVNQCLRDACDISGVPYCREFIDCGHGNVQEFASKPDWLIWQNEGNASNCFNTASGSFSYGIYQQAVLISTEHSIITRYIYSLFWGFLQISTLAGNQVPSSFVWEVLFTMGIIGLGLLLFALLIGNMQNFLQALGRRKLEMQLRRRDVEQWMSHRRLPEDLRRLVRQSERFSWAATRGVNEELLLENFPEDLQREIRRYLFKFVKKVRIFTVMDDPIVDAICERLRQKLYIAGSKILYRGGPVEKMVFIVRGKMESIGGDGNVAPLSDGDVCGEELLTWCLEHSSANKDGRKMRLSGAAGQRLLSSRTVKCLTNVEAFALRAVDLEEVTSFFARFLRNPRVQGAIRYESPYWREMAAIRIQVAWKYMKKRHLDRTETTNHQSYYARY